MNKDTKRAEIRKESLTGLASLFADVLDFVDACLLEDEVEDDGRPAGDGGS